MNAGEKKTISGAFELIPKWLPIIMTIGSILVSSTLTYAAVIYGNAERDHRIEKVEVNITKLSDQQTKDREGWTRVQARVEWMAGKMGYPEGGGQ